MILTDAINLVLAEYPGMKAIGAAESADAWIIGLDFASSTDDHPVPGTPSVAVEKTSGVLHDLIPGDGRSLALHDRCQKGDYSSDLKSALVFP